MSTETPVQNLIEWSDELSVGIQEIDAQHKILVDVINEFYNAMQNRRGSAVTGRILDKLDEYTRIHFVVEESLMRILGYARYEEHKLEHENLIEQLKELRKKFEAKDRSISFELMHLLKVWLTKHILETDKRYSSYFLAKGVEPRLSKTSWVDRLWHPKTK